MESKLEGTVKFVAIESLTVDRLHHELELPQVGLFAVLDACDEPRVPEKVAELGERAACLYSGEAERDYWAIAPYLAQVDRPLLDWIVEELGEAPWGVLLRCSCDLRILRNHLRRFLMANLPDDQKMLFRFYDPRVLPAFLQTCTREELDQFFGPIDCFFAQERSGAFLSVARSTTRGEHRAS